MSRRRLTTYLTLEIISNKMRGRETIEEEEANKEEEEDELSATNSNMLQ